MANYSIESRLSLPGSLEESPGTDCFGASPSRNDIQSRLAASVFRILPSFALTSLPALVLHIVKTYNEPHAPFSSFISYEVFYDYGIPNNQYYSLL